MENFNHKGRSMTSAAVTTDNFQLFFNVAITLIGFLGGWVLNSLKASIEGLQKADTELTTKVQSIEVLVAGQYVRRDDFNQISAEMFRKLDKIYDKLDEKADKP